MRDGMFWSFDPPIRPTSRIAIPTIPGSSLVVPRPVEVSVVRPPVVGDPDTRSALTDRTAHAACLADAAQGQPRRSKTAAGRNRSASYGNARECSDEPPGTPPPREPRRGGMSADRLLRTAVDRRGRGWMRAETPTLTQPLRVSPNDPARLSGWSARAGDPCRSVPVPGDRASEPRPSRHRRSPCTRRRAAGDTRPVSPRDWTSGTDRERVFAPPAETSRPARRPSVDRETARPGPDPSRIRARPEDTP